MKYQEGDTVRVKVYKGVFGKGYSPRFSREVFTITKTFARHPPVYEIVGADGDSITGKWLEAELINA